MQPAKMLLEVFNPTVKPLLFAMNRLSSFMVCSLTDQSSPQTGDASKLKQFSTVS